MMRETFARVDIRALVENYEALASLAPVTAVVKANAYGHGAERCARALWGAGCRRFAVATAGEGVRLRRTLPSATILVLGSTPIPCTAELAAYRLTQTLYSYPYAIALSRTLTTPLSVALKLETGMHRYGFSCDSWGLERATSVLHAPNLQVDEIFSHPATEQANKALTTFRAAAEVLDPTHSTCQHFANTGLALTTPEARLDTIRCGIGLYGYGAPFLKPVLSLHSRVVQLHHLAVGESVGYGGAFVAERPSTIAVIPIGYGDGFLRAYTGGTLWIKDQPAPIIGRICMDVCMVDATDIQVRAGDPVTLWDDTHPVTALADTANTIPYESLTLLSDRVRRFYIIDK